MTILLRIVLDDGPSRRVAAMSSRINRHVSVAMPMTPGGMPMQSIGRKLLSVSNAGKVNWNLTLD